MPQRDMTIKEYEGFTNHIVDEEGNVVGILNIWMNEDIESAAKELLNEDAELEKDEISNILISLTEGFDANIGINWETIKETISNYLDE